MTQVKLANVENISLAATYLKDGQNVVIPTETVYGLAGNALDGKAVARIFELKGRPNFNPLITHVPNLETARQYGNFSPQALELASVFWPGPLTMVVKQKPDNGISELVTAGLKTMAIRIPNHKVALDVLMQCGVPTAAPSANISGRLSPTSPTHIDEELASKLPMILAGGSADVGLESTVIDLSDEKPVLLRPGAITKEQIEQALGCEVIEGFDEQTDQPKSPGLLVKHYAPSIPVRLKTTDVKKGEALLAFGTDKFISVEEGGFAKNLPSDRYQNLSSSGDLTEAAANLFRMLHLLDGNGNTSIAVMDIPNVGLGVAINDRLKRAATK